MIPLFLNLVSTAADRLLRNRERSLTLTLCLVAILFPFLTAMAVSDGLRFQTRLSLEQGADFTLTRDNYGGPGPVSQTDLTRLQQSLKVDGVRINGRIIGRTYFVNRLIAVVGLDQPPRELASLLSDGRIFQREGEVLLGYHLARAFNLETGVRFSLTANPGKLFTLVGVLPPLGLWDSDLMVLSVRDAQQFFRMGGHFSEIQINTLRDTRPVPGLLEKNAGAFLSGPSTLQRMSREEAGRLAMKGYGFRNGIFIVFYALILALALPALLVASGIGSEDTLREIGLMKALGWTRKNIIGLTLLEGFLLSLTATTLAVLFSLAWMKGTNGFLITPFLIAETGLVPDFQVPTRYLPLPVLGGLLGALAIALGGNLFYTWYGIRKPPYPIMH